MRPFLLLVAASVVLAASPRERSGASRASLHVPVWTAGGASLSISGLNAKIGGRPAKVVGLRSPDDGLIVLMVMDVVGDLSLVDTARQALVEAVSKLPVNVYTGLMRAQDGLRVLLDPTPDRERVAETIRSVPVSGRAGLMNTVETAARIGDSILAKANVRIALLYVTDSNVYNYREDYTNPVVNSSDSRDLSRRFPEALIKERVSRVVAGLAATQTPLFIVHLDYRSDRLNEAYQTGLLEMASVTGGAAEFCRSFGEIPAAVHKTLETITAHWSVELALPEHRTSQTSVVLDSANGSLRHRSRFHLSDR